MPAAPQGAAASADAPAAAPPVRPAGRARFAAIGFAGGFLGSLLGVGGGFVMVPLQVLWARVGQHQANGTSLAAIAPISLAGVAVYAFAGGKVDLHLALPLIVGSVLGAYVGARASARVPEAKLRRAVAVVLVLAGLKQIVFPG